MPFALSVGPKGQSRSASGSLRIALLAAALVLSAGCPEERPGATKEIPTQRIPPAMSLESQPAPTGGGAPGATPRKGSTPPAPSPGRTEPRP